MNFVPHKEDTPSDSCTSEPLKPLSLGTVVKNLARTAATAPAAARAVTVLTPVDTVRRLSVPGESREGYTRNAFKSSEEMTGTQLSNEAGGPLRGFACGGRGRADGERLR